MKRSALPLVIAAAGGALALSGTLLLSRAEAQPPATAAASAAAVVPASVTAAPSAAASPAGTAAASSAPAADGEVEKPIDFEPIPPAGDRPQPPKPAEWQSATRVAFTRQGPRAKRCRMHRVREWARVHCDGQTTAIGLMGGAPAGAFFGLPEAKEGEPAPTAADVMFPLRVGDRRVFELFSYGPAYGGSKIAPGLVLQEHWVSGEPAPVVVIH